jgi:hypothetical protein
MSTTSDQIIARVRNLQQTASKAVELAKQEREKRGIAAPTIELARRDNEGSTAATVGGAAAAGLAGYGTLAYLRGSSANANLRGIHLKNYRARSGFGRVLQDLRKGNALNVAAGKSVAKNIMGKIGALKRFSESEGLPGRVKELALKVASKKE